MSVVFLGASNPETARMIAAVSREDPTFTVRGFIDNDPGKKGSTFVGYPVLGGFEMLEELTAEDGVEFVNLITRDTLTRYETSREMAAAGCRFTNFIHPSVDLQMVKIGVGNYVQEATILQAGVQLGNNSSIHMGALVGHETTIGDSVFIAHGCSISGLVQIGDGVLIGTNATVLPRIRIGRWASIGAGTVVARDVPDHATVLGSPGRVIQITDAPPYENGDIFAGTGA